MLTKKQQMFFGFGWLVISGAILTLLIVLRAPSAQAIECNGVLTTEDCVNTEPVAAITGNYQTAVAAIGMYPQEATETITINIPNCTVGTPTIVRATAYWALRDLDDFTFWDETVDIARDAGGATTVNSDRRYKALIGPSATSSYVADITAAGIVTTGSHTYTITNLDVSAGAVDPNTSQWGFGIHVIYECPEYPVVTVQQTEGHDVHWYNLFNGWDTDRSELICEQLSASVVSRNVNLDFFIQGSVDPILREADIWYKTGTGTAPAPTAYDLLTDVNTPANGGTPLQRLIFVGEPEMEPFNNTITVPAGDEYVCLQFDSSFTIGTHPDDITVRGASMYSGLGWFVYPPATSGVLSLGNLVWEDSNNNGIVDGTEAGICGVDVHLYVDIGGDGKYDSAVEGTIPARTTTTACSGTVGEYLFGSLAADDYIVVIPQSEFTSGQPLESYVSSSGTNGVSTGAYEPAPDPDNDTNDDDNGFHQSADGVVSCAVTLTVGGEPINDGDADNNSNLSVDFGFFNDAKLGDFVWYDTNNNGVQDSGETGVVGVIATLYDATTNTALATQTTDANGAYSFCYLEPGSYYVIFTNLPTDYTLVSTDTGSDDAADSDADQSTARTGTYVLAAGDNNTTVDGGIVTSLAATGIGFARSFIIGGALSAAVVFLYKPARRRYSIK